jgi:hypothetical protein
MPEFFKMGGFAMWPILIFGLVTLAAAARYAAQPDTIRARQALALGLLELLTGAGGTLMGFVVTLTSMGEVPADMRFIAMIGVGESLTCMVLAVVFCILAALIGVVGTWRPSLPDPVRAPSPLRT